MPGSGNGFFTDRLSRKTGVASNNPVIVKAEGVLESTHNVWKGVYNSFPNRPSLDGVGRFNPDFKQEWYNKQYSYKKGEAAVDADSTQPSIAPHILALCEGDVGEARELAKEFYSRASRAEGVKDLYNAKNIP